MSTAANPATAPRHQLAGPRLLGANLTAAGQQVTYQELAPLTQDDPAGAGLTALGLPLRSPRSR